MYETIKQKTLQEQIEYIARQLIQTPSINGTKGEAELADKIRMWIASFPYFNENPDHLWVQEIPNDELGRKNVFALVKGEADATETVVFQAHIDTVGVKDYGNLQDRAFDPDALQEFFKDYDANPQLQKEAQSDDWLFGRGALDMQSGDAVHLANLLYFSEHPEKLNGNLLVMFNPDEETQHKGVMAAITELKRLRDESGFNFIGAINSDFISPLYEGDETRYIYTGAAGKLLPSFYIYGRESHVGETLKGINSTLVASEINRKINNNIDLVEDIEGEVVLPPSCLYQRDGKVAYNVQTPFKSYMYFNYFIYEESPKQIIDKLKKVTEEACHTVEKRLEANYLHYIKRTGMPKSQISWHLEVNTLEEFVILLEERGVNTEQVINEVLEKYKGMELREAAFQIVEALQQQDEEKKPRVILFYGPPHCPHNYLKEDNERDQAINRAMHEVVEETDSDESFAIKRFFPFLSDSSYLSLHETDEELESLIRNSAAWGKLYSVPVKEIRSLSIPSINMGVFGKDAHKWTERVYKPYSYHTLPLLIRRLTEKLLT